MHACICCFSKEGAKVRSLSDGITKMVYSVVLATKVRKHKDYLPYLPDVLLIWAPNDCNVISGSSLSFCGSYRSWVRLPAEPLKTLSHHIWLYLPYRHVSQSDSSVGKSVHVTWWWTFLQKCHKTALSCHLLLWFEWKKNRNKIKIAELSLKWYSLFGLD